MLNSAVSLRVLRFLARILSILSFGIISLFAFGEELQPQRLTALELVLFAFFPLGVYLGMILAWRWEALGGGITLASLIVFYLLHRLLSSSFPRGFAFLALAAPGFLFLLYWMLTRSRKRYIDNLKSHN